MDDFSKHASATHMKLSDLSNTPPWEWSADAGDVLLATLRDEKATDADRRLAADLAGDLVVMNDALAAALLALLENGQQPDETRARAAISLGPVLEEMDTADFEVSDDNPITETTFKRIQKTLRQIYLDGNTPKDVRRKALEASVRAQERWHRDAVAAAVASGDEEWKLTAVFCMQYVKGFDNPIVEALNSTNPDIQYEAVVAAGNWEIGAAWPQIVRLLAESTDKPLLLAAIEAAAAIRPDEARRVLGDLCESDDDEIVDAVREAIEIARVRRRSMGR
jgi:hypothetical protein